MACTKNFNGEPHNVGKFTPGEIGMALPVKTLWYFNRAEGLDLSSMLPCLGDTLVVAGSLEKMVGYITLNVI